jgi:hypothetical protein
MQINKLGIIYNVLWLTRFPRTGNWSLECCEAWISLSINSAMKFSISVLCRLPHAYTHTQLEATGSTYFVIDNEASTMGTAIGFLWPRTEIFTHRSPSYAPHNFHSSSFQPKTDGFMIQMMWFRQWKLCYQFLLAPVVPPQHWLQVWSTATVFMNGQYTVPDFMQHDFMSWVRR